MRVRKRKCDCSNSEYMKRSAEAQNLCLMDYVSEYTYNSKGQLRKRGKLLVVRVVPRIPRDPKNAENTNNTATFCPLRTRRAPFAALVIIGRLSVRCRQWSRARRRLRARRRFIARQGTRALDALRIAIRAGSSILRRLAAAMARAACFATCATRAGIKVIGRRIVRQRGSSSSKRRRKGLGRSHPSPSRTARNCPD